MAHDENDDPIWTAVLRHAEECGGEANDFHAVDEIVSDANRPLYVLVHPGDVVQSDNDVAFSDNAKGIQDYSRSCQAGIENDVERLQRYGWDLAVLHRFSSSYAFGVSGCIQEYTEAVDTIHEVGLVLFGDNLREAADYLIAEMDAVSRPAIQLSGAWSEDRTGCIAALGQMLEEAGARVYLADSACLSPDGAGEEWSPQRSYLTEAQEKDLVPPPRIAFQDDMEGEDGVFVHMISRAVSVQPDLAPGRYFRFGPGNPIVRLKAMTPEAYNRVYTFENADGQTTDYPVDEMIARMKRQDLEILRPLVWPIAKMHEMLLAILGHGATCLAATIEGHLMLSRPPRTELAADVARGKLTLAAMDRTKATRGGIVDLERAITEQISHEVETVTRLEGKTGGAGKIRRHREIANSLQNARSALSAPYRSDPAKARDRLAAAIEAASQAPAPTPRSRRSKASLSRQPA